MPRAPSYLLLVAALLAGCRSEPARTETCRAAQPAQPTRAVERWAVLVNGDSERRHKNNIAQAYRTLSALGFASGHIVTVSPRDSRFRLPKGALRLNPVPDNFWDIMDELVHLVEPGDLLLVYGTGHGDTDGGDSLLELRRGEIWPADLREEIDRVRGDTVIVMDQCFSGGFADALQGTKSRVIAIASVDRDHLTDCYYFARTFWDAFLHPERADRNGDGRTSLREAFEAASREHRRALAGDPELAADAAFRSFNGFQDAVLNN